MTDETTKRSLKEMGLPEFGPLLVDALPHWADREDQWSARIKAAHPVNNGSDKTYALAMDMVGTRNSKGALVDLVNWLLQGQP